jgi:hypothetical protein
MRLLMKLILMGQGWSGGFMDLYCEVVFGNAFGPCRFHCGKLEFCNPAMLKVRDHPI